MNTTLAICVATFSALLLSTSSGFSQSADGVPVRLHGTLTTVSEPSLRLSETNGMQDTIVRGPTFRISTVKAATMSDIKPGDFVGAGGMKNADGSFRAIQIVIFPEALRGTGEGIRMWDLGPDSIMVNATVGEAVASPEGGALTLRTGDKEANVTVAKGIPVVHLAQGSPAMLVPGKAAVVNGIRQADGVVVARSITVESEGVNPP